MQYFRVAVVVYRIRPLSLGFGDLADPPEVRSPDVPIHFHDLEGNVGDGSVPINIAGEMASPSLIPCMNPLGHMNKRHHHTAIIV